MFHSTITKDGQTTIPGEIRKALRMRAGDQLEYFVEGDHAVIRIHSGLLELKGALRSAKGKGMSFDQIRERAAKNAVNKMRRQRKAK